MAIEEVTPDLDGAGLRVAIVQSRFNEWAGQALAQACIDELLRLGLDEGDIVRVTVPGALEVPLTLARLADGGDFDALIALGCVIRGDTYHFEVVANESAAGLTRVALDAGVPVVNGILTTDDEAQARLRVNDKGRDAARVAVEMGNLMWTLAEDGEAGSGASQ
jgi:6,7-dimethyl-8-ribityllumazine synthase